MKNTEKMEAILKYDNSIGEYIVFKDDKVILPVSEFLKVIDKNKKDNVIKDGRVIEGKTGTYYSFSMKKFSKINDEDKKLKLVVGVKNNEKIYHQQTLRELENRCELAAKIKKLNIARGIAIAVATLTVATLSVPAIAKGLSKLDEKDYEYNYDRTQEYQNQYQDGEWTYFEESESKGISK